MPSSSSSSSPLGDGSSVREQLNKDFCIHCLSSAIKKATVGYDLISSHTLDHSPLLRHKHLSGQDSEVAQHLLQQPQELRLHFKKVAGETHLHLYSFATTSAAVLCYTESEISDMFLWYLWKSREHHLTIYTTTCFRAAPVFPRESWLKCQMPQEPRLVMQMLRRGCRLHFCTAEVKW